MIKFYPCLFCFFNYLSKHVASDSICSPREQGTGCGKVYKVALKPWSVFRWESNCFCLNTSSQPQDTLWSETWLIICWCIPKVCTQKIWSGPFLCPQHLRFERLILNLQKSSDLPLVHAIGCEKKCLTLLTNQIYPATPVMSLITKPHRHLHSLHLSPRNRYLERTITGNHGILRLWKKLIFTMVCSRYDASKEKKTVAEHFSCRISLFVWQIHSYPANLRKTPQMTCYKKLQATGLQKSCVV